MLDWIKSIEYKGNKFYQNIKMIVYNEASYTYLKICFVVYSRVWYFLSQGNRLDCLDFPSNPQKRLLEVFAFQTLTGKTSRRTFKKP